MRFQYLALALALTSQVSAGVEYLDSDFEPAPTAAAVPTTTKAYVPTVAPTTTDYPSVDPVAVEPEPTEEPAEEYPSVDPVATTTDYPSVDPVATTTDYPSVDPVATYPSTTTSCTKSLGQSSAAVPAGTDYEAPSVDPVATYPASTPTYVSSFSVGPVPHTTTSCTKGQSSAAVPKPNTTSAPVYEPSEIPAQHEPEISYTTTTTEYDTEVVTKPCDACQEQTYTDRVTKTITVPCSAKSTPVYPTDDFSTIPAPETYTTVSSTRTHTYYHTVTVPKPQTSTYPVDIPTYSSTVTLQTTVTLHTETGTKTQTITYQTPAAVPSCPGDYGCPSTLVTQTPAYTPTYTPVYPPSVNTTVPVAPPAYTGAAGKIQITGVFVASAIMAVAAIMNL